MGYIHVVVGVILWVLSCPFVVCEWVFFMEMFGVAGAS